MIFPPFVVVPRSTGAPPVSHHDVGRGKGLGKDAGAAQAGEVRADSLGGASGGPLGLVMAMAWLVDFHPILFGILGFSEFRG